MQSPDNEHKFQKERIQNFFNQVSKFHHDMVANVNLQINNLIKEVIKRMIQIKHLNYKLIDEWVMIHKMIVDEQYIKNIHQMKTMQGLSRLILESNDLENIKQYFNQYIAQAIQIDSLQNMQYQKENVDFFMNYIQHFQNQILSSFDNNFKNLALGFFKKKTRLNLKYELDNIQNIFLQQEVNYYEHMAQVIKEINKNQKLAEYAQMNNNNNNFNTPFQGQYGQVIANPSTQQPINNSYEFQNNQNNYIQNIDASKVNPLIQKSLLSQVAEKQAYKKFFAFNQFNSDSQTNQISQININEKDNQVGQQIQQQIYLPENDRQQQIQIWQQRDSNTFHDQGNINSIQTDVSIINPITLQDQSNQLTPLSLQKQQLNKFQQNEIEDQNTLLNNQNQQAEQVNMLNQNINIEGNFQESLQQQSFVTLPQETIQNNQNDELKQINNNLILNNYQNEGNKVYCDEKINSQYNTQNINENILDHTKIFKDNSSCNSYENNLTQSTQSEQNNAFLNRDNPFQSLQNNPLQNEQYTNIQTQGIYQSQLRQNNPLQNTENMNSDLIHCTVREQEIQLTNEQNGLSKNNQKQFIENFFSLQQDQAEQILNIVQLQLDDNQAYDKQVQHNQNNQVSNIDDKQQIYSIEQHIITNSQVDQVSQIQQQTQEQITEKEIQPEKQLTDNQNEIQVEDENESFQDNQQKQVQDIQANREQVIVENEEQSVQKNQIDIENPDNQFKEKDLNQEQHIINSQIITEIEIASSENSTNIQENQIEQHTVQQTIEEEKVQQQDQQQKQLQQDDLEDCIIYENPSEIASRESEIKQKQRNKSQQKNLQFQKQKFKVKSQDTIIIDEDDETEKQQAEKMVVEDVQADQIFFMKQEGQSKTKKTIKKQTTNELENIQEEDLFSNFQEKMTSHKNLKLQEEHDVILSNQNCKNKQNEITDIQNDDQQKSIDLLIPTQQTVIDQENSLFQYYQNLNNQNNNIINNQEVKTKKQQKISKYFDQKDQKDITNQSQLCLKQQSNDAQISNQKNKTSEILVNQIEEGVIQQNNNLQETNNKLSETYSIIEETQQKAEQQTIQIDQLFPDDSQLFTPIQNKIEKAVENVQNQFTAKKIIVTKKSMINENAQKIQKPKHIKLNIVKIPSVKAAIQSQQNNKQDEDIINKSMNLSFWEKDIEKTDLNFNFCKKYIPSKQPLTNNTAPKNYYIN